MPAEFEPDHAGLREYLLSGELYPALEEHAALIEARAHALASEHVLTGAYLRGIEIVRTRTDERVEVEVRATDRISAILEAAYHVMGRAAG